MSDYRCRNCQRTLETKEIDDGLCITCFYIPEDERE